MENVLEDHLRALGIAPEEVPLMEIGVRLGPSVLTDRDRRLRSLTSGLVPQRTMGRVCVRVQGPRCGATVRQTRRDRNVAGCGPVQDFEQSSPQTQGSDTAVD